MLMAPIGKSPRFMPLLLSDSVCDNRVMRSSFSGAQNNNKRGCILYMRLSVEYVNDADGNVLAVQVPVAQWKRMLQTLRANEQKERIKRDIVQALKEVEQLGKSKQRPQTLKEFLREL